MALPLRPPDPAGASLFRRHYATALAGATRRRMSHFRGVLVPSPPPYFTPPILQTSFHSASVTGCTDSRPYFTSAMSFSFGAALIAASVTGSGSGSTALTSTTTHGSPALAVGSG